MRIGLISDTHGHTNFTQPALRMLATLEVEAILHSGDIGSAEVVELFADGPPTHFVLGNCDYDPACLQAAVEQAGHTFHGLFADLEFAGVRVALLHSHERERFRRTIHSGDYGLVCYGHTHTAAIDRHGETLVVNPGAVYRAQPHSVAIVDLPACEATIVEL